MTTASETRQTTEAEIEQAVGMYEDACHLPFRRAGK
jgi:hypothetical protein